MPTAPTPITPYATPPSSDDPVNFDARADAKVADDVAKVAEYNALAENVYDNAVEAEGSASDALTAKAAAESAQAAAQANADAAAASAGATAWNAATNYSSGVRVWSSIDQQLYRRVVPGVSATDPANDSTNWALVRSVAESLSLLNAGVI